MITREEALRRYRHGNNSGLGYAPYTDDVQDDRVAEAVLAARRDGWRVMRERESTSDVVVLVNGDGQLMAIGGDGIGRGAWAVDISDPVPEDV